MHFWSAHKREGKLLAAFRKDEDDTYSGNFFYDEPVEGSGVSAINGMTKTPFCMGLTLEEVESRASSILFKEVLKQL